ncbi:MAG: D-arabinono-1,4-lactone oxidase [Archangium sp.]
MTVNNLPDDENPSRDASPNTIATLTRELVEAPRTARALAGGWGFSHAGCTTGTRVRMLAFSGVELAEDLLPGMTSREFDFDLAVPNEQPGPLFRVLAGTSFGDLNRALHPWTVLNQPGFAELTFGGVMSVGGHGSGLKRGNIASQVRSMDLLTVPVRGSVKLVRLEPAPLTDPVAFKARFGPDPSKAELIVDAALFNAAKVSFGSMGVLHSAVIDTRPAYRLNEDRDVRDLWHDWDKIEAQVRDPNVAAVHLWVNPYRVGSDYKALQSTYRRSLDMQRNERGWGIREADAPFTRYITTGIAKELPYIMPFALEFSFGALAADVVLPSPEAQDFGPPNKMRVSASSISFPSEGLRATVEALLNHFHQTFPKNLVSSLIGIRWVKASDAPLAPQIGRDSVMIEVPVLNGTANQSETLQKYVEFAITKLRGRPHWGQRLWMTKEQLRAIYGQDNVQQFIDARRRLDPLGVFDNSLTRELGL